MKSFKINKELIIIITVWLLVFASSPMHMLYMHTTYSLDFSWERICESWIYILGFLVLFLIHHYVLIPKFIVRKKISAYLGCLLLVMCCFTAFVVTFEPLYHPIPELARHTPRRQTTHMSERPMIFPRNNAQMEKMPKPQKTPIAPPDMIRILISLLMLGVDLGAVAWMNEQKLRSDMLLLERQSLKQELEHLRYQINPHFFMNTLNNIHALVDIDTERAKRAIVEMSRLMRYALYENNASLVELSHEIEFLNHFISLMRLRYSDDKLEIQCNLPDNTSKGVRIPPMLLATFVENAFKHGVSYLSYSFINIHLWLEDDSRTIRFQCNNSRHRDTTISDDEAHGIGLENVRKRLDLQYGNNYKLEITDTSKDIFGIDLTLKWQADLATKS